MDLSTKQQLGATCLNAARYQIILCKYTDGYKSLETCFQSFSPHTYAHSYTLELAFYLDYYQERFRQSFEVMKNLLNNLQYEGSDYQREKWQYLQACSCFKLGDYKSANRMLAKQYPELERDKDGWAAYLQVLRIMTHVERKQFDLADSAIEQLHYFLKKKQPKARLKAIAEVLLTLKNSGYHFKELKEDKQLTRLSSNKGWHVKQNLEPEMVCFDEWVNARLA
ncbi:MAG: hypothetical protein H8D62_01190 [Bacteroidetes bacterium]|nr:hypothetical protein [Bacteroidota bacterium]